MKHVTKFFIKVLIFPVAFPLLLLATFKISLPLYLFGGSGEPPSVWEIVKITWESYWSGFLT